MRTATGSAPVELPGGTVLVGYRSKFRLRPMATRLHLFVAVADVPVVDHGVLMGLTYDALAYAKRSKGRFRGLQTGVAVLAGAVSENVDESARWCARVELVRQFGAFAWPVCVDLGRGDVLSHADDPMLGWVYNRWLREQIAVAFAAPRDAR